MEAIVSTGREHSTRSGSDFKEAACRHSLYLLGTTEVIPGAHSVFIIKLAIHAILKKSVMLIRDVASREKQEYANLILETPSGLIVNETMNISRSCVAHLLPIFTAISMQAP